MGPTDKDLEELNGPGPTAADLEELNGPAAPTPSLRPSASAVALQQLAEPAPEMPKTRKEETREVFERWEQRNAPFAAGGRGSKHEWIAGPLGAVQTVLPITNQAVGLGNAIIGSLKGRPESFGDLYREGRDKSQKFAEEVRKTEPERYGTGSAGTMLLAAGPKLVADASAKLFGPVSALTKPATFGGRVAAGATDAALAGAAASSGDLTKGQYGKVAWDAVKTGALGAVLSVPSGVGTAAKSGAAEKEYKHQITRDLTDGANPTHARRAVGDDGAAETLVSWLERTPEARKAVANQDRAALMDAAYQTTNKLGKLNKPVYEKFDKAVGEVPYAKLDGDLADLQTELGKSHDQNKQLIAAFQEVRDDLALKSKNNAKKTLTHQQVREWVSGLLRAKQNVKGTINETPAALYKEELHQAADEILRTHMEWGATMHTGLADELTALRTRNRDISAAIRAEDVAENAEKLAHWKRKTIAEKAESGARKAISGAGVGGLVGGSLAGPVGAIGLGLVGAVAPAALGKATRVSVDLAGRLSRAAKAGNIDAKLWQEALDSGVSERALRVMLANNDKR